MTGVLLSLGVVDMNVKREGVNWKGVVMTFHHPFER